jgi:hypothetical protein
LKPRLKFIWGASQVIKGRWNDGLYGFNDRVEGVPDSGLALSVRGLLAWSTSLVLAGYLAAASALLWVGTAAVTAAVVTATAVGGRVGAAAVVAVAVTVANPGRRRARVRDAAGIGVSERAWLLEQLLLKDTVSYGASTEPNIQKLPTHFEHTNWK